MNVMKNICKYFQIYLVLRLFISDCSKVICNAKVGTGVSKKVTKHGIIIEQSPMMAPYYNLENIRHQT